MPEPDRTEGGHGGTKIRREWNRSPHDRHLRQLAFRLKAIRELLGPCRLRRVVLAAEVDMLSPKVKARANVEGAAWWRLEGARVELQANCIVGRACG